MSDLLTTRVTQVRLQKLWPKEFYFHFILPEKKKPQSNKQTKIYKTFNSNYFNKFSHDKSFGNSTFAFEGKEDVQHKLRFRDS